MTEWSLAEIIAEIQKGLLQMGEDELETAYILERLDFVGELNKVHGNPLNRNGEKAYFRPRATPLTGQERIKGEHLVFTYIGHNEDMYMRECGSQAELEKEIVGGGGYPNRFTTHCLPVVGGKPKPYCLVFTHSVEKREMIFEKGNHDFIVTVAELNRITEDLRAHCQPDEVAEAIRNISGKVDYDMLNMRIKWLD